MSCDSLSNLYLWHIKYSFLIISLLPLSVVIRFQICIFDILNTATYFCHTFIICCDSLSNLYLWHIKYSYFSHIATKYSIVIRFQICIFDILNTALYLDSIISVSCDSLSNLYLWHIKYSVWRCDTTLLTVVIRFQICIFDILNTATATVGNTDNELWFAFKFVSLTY